MNDTLLFLGSHGPLVLFAAVFVEQIGLPVPAAPLLLAAGGAPEENSEHQTPSTRETPSFPEAWWLKLEA